MRIDMLLAVIISVQIQGVADAAFFDLRGLGDIGGSSKSVTVDGLTLSVSTQSGQLISVDDRFGIESNGAADVSDLIDGGNGFPEQLFFIFNNNDAVLDQVIISQFDAEDAGVLNIKVQGDFPLANGANLLAGVQVSTSLHHIRWAGENAPGVGREFSVDGFVAHVVPEPSSILIGVPLALTSVFGLRARKR